MPDGPATKAQTDAETSELQAILVGIGEKNASAYDWLFQKYWKLVRGTIRGIVGPVDIVDDIAQEVWLVVWTHPPAAESEFRVSGFVNWLKTVAHNRAVSYLRSGGRRSQASRADYERLFDSARGGGIPLHKKIVVALHVFSNCSIETIVELADQRLVELVPILKSIQDEHLVEPLLREIGDQPDSKLRNFLTPTLDPAKCVSNWIQSLGRIADGLRPEPEMPRGEPFSTVNQAVMGTISPEVFRDSIKLVLSETRAPHQELTFLLNKFLDMKPAEISRKFGSRSIEELLEQAFVRCVQLEVRCVSTKMWNKFFEPLRAIMLHPVLEAITDESTRASYKGNTTLNVGATRLHEYSGDISHWVNAAQKRFIRRTCDLESDLLASIFGGKSAPNKSLTFAHTSLLRIAVSDFAKRSDDRLRVLSEDFFEGYRGKTFLDQNRLNRCADSFIRQLNGRFGTRMVGDLELQEFYTDDQTGDRTGQLAAWRDEVQRRVISEFRNREGGLIFTYACGYL